ncbi:hypothetical protein Nepgr_026377 [Nepenthes gracilis]|uniref:Homeobox domain-containing protein n=1 Tax=Nepenthes gracilis TaxID=150966 RepID=A0AAD3T8C6_NEPGR|nr:hypothetical protein Nepgr_026377 [Nepenthes gracilis]
MGWDNKSPPPPPPPPPLPQLEPNHHQHQNNDIVDGGNGAAAVGGVLYVKVMTDEQLEILRTQIAVYATICEQLVEMHKAITAQQDLAGVRLGNLYWDPLVTSAGHKITARQRWTPTPMQLQILERIFDKGLGIPSKQKIKDITAELSLHGQISETNVYNWFQNRRARSKRKQPNTAPSNAESEVETDAESPKEKKREPENLKLQASSTPGAEDLSFQSREISSEMLSVDPQTDKLELVLPSNGCSKPSQSLGQPSFYGSILQSSIHAGIDHLIGKLEMPGSYNPYQQADDYSMSDFVSLKLDFGLQVFTVDLPKRHAAKGHGVITYSVSTLTSCVEIEDEIGMQQIRCKIGVYYGNPEVTSGGIALKFFASLCLEIWPIGKVKFVNGDEDIGLRVRVRVQKEFQDQSECNCCGGCLDVEESRDCISRLLKGVHMENVCDTNHLNADALLPPRKRLLAGLKKQNFESPSQCSQENSNSVSLSRIDARIKSLMESYKNGLNMSLEEITVASGSAAAAAARAAEAARAAAEEKSAIAAKAVAAAKRALDLVASYSEQRSSKERYQKKNKLKKHVPVQLLYKKYQPVKNCRTDEELARKLHRAMNSSPRISKKFPDSDSKNHKHKKLKISSTNENGRFPNGISIKEGNCLPTLSRDDKPREIGSEAFIEESGIANLDDKVSKSITPDKIEETSGDAESNQSVEKNFEASDDLCTNGRKRGRIKQKKLSLSLCSFKDQANPRDELNPTSSTSVREATDESVERGLSFPSMGPIADGIQSIGATTTWKCQDFKVSNCMKQNKVVQS